MPKTPLLQSFVPHPLLPGGQLQTVAAQLFGPPPPLSGSERLLVPLPDGDQLLLQREQPASGDDAAQPLVLLMHGLGGSAESTYIKRISHKLTAHGRTSLRFNHRGCGDGAAHLAKGIYHSGRTEDLAAVLQFVEQQWPGRPYLVIGFSLSGNLLLNFLGTSQLSLPLPGLRQALAVCPAIDLEACSLALTLPRNWHIERYYTFHVTRQALQREARLGHTQVTFPRRMSLRAFDELYTARRAGFKNRADYYARCSAAPVLQHIRVPTQILAAADDPVVPGQSFANLKLSPAVQLRLEKTGGHMGFIARDRTRFGDFRWMDAQVMEWVWAAAAPRPAP